jgi:hypothetical protein
VSLRIMLGLVEHGIATEQFHQAQQGLSQLADQINSAEAVLAETTSGVSSSILLTERGLIAALNADLSTAHPPIAVTAAETLSGRRFSPDIEAAVYFGCLEAVNNARKHAPGAAVKVRLDEVEGALRFVVHDDGPGFSESANDVTVGRGLRNVTARIAAVGGRLSIRSVPNTGTTIEGFVPLPREQGLLDRVRALVREARTLYDGSSDSERLRQLQTQLAGHSGVRQASSALRALDNLLRSSPLDGRRTIKLRYQLEQIRSETHELTEINLLDELQSGTLPLTSEECQLAEQLLGTAGSEPRARLGLTANADTAEIRQAAEQQLTHWQRRAIHPTSTRAIRDAAEVLVRTCEQLLAQISTR